MPAAVKLERRSVSTKGNGDIVDITGDVSAVVSQGPVADGLATIFVTGSTAAVTTIEFEPGVVSDLQDAFERLYPREIVYRHHERWGDDNGHSHVRAGALGPSLAIPFIGNTLTLGTWQQIVIVDFDTRPRSRDYVVQLLGLESPGEADH